jgi:hypothetical protein
VSDNTLGAYNIADLREMARRRLPHGIFEFIDRGTEDEVALRNNRAAFERIRFRPRTLVDVSARSQEITLFGRKSPLPIAVGPTGTAGLLWYQGEVGLAKAAAAAGIPFTVAINSMTSMETIAEQAGGRLWFQLYMWSERSLSHQIVARAKEAGFEALIVTVDGAVRANREYGHRNGFEMPFRFNRRNVGGVLARPGWLINVLLRYAATSGVPKFENYPPDVMDRLTARTLKSSFLKNDSLTWESARCGARRRERSGRRYCLESWRAHAGQLDGADRGAARDRGCGRQAHHRHDGQRSTARRRRGEGARAGRTGGVDRTGDALRYGGSGRSGCGARHCDSA